MKTMRLRAGKERSLLRRHPWVFQGSVERGGGDTGETVRVEAHDGSFLAWGIVSPRSMIRVRAWSFDEAEPLDEALIARRVHAALRLRRRLGIASNGQRLIHGEADGLPGLIVDRYDDTLSLQALSAGAERWKPVLVAALREASGLDRIYERSDAAVRQLEGLAPKTGWLAGGAGEGPVTRTIDEHGWQLEVDIAQGHKTGYYLDQRDNRGRFAAWVRQLGCQRVLNGFSYTGGFSVAALAGGAREVLSIDSSGPALARAQAHVEANAAACGYDPAGHAVLDADVNASLRQFLKDGRRFDAIVLDPPKFAPSAAHADRAARAYKDINRLAFKLLEPGGLLLTFSCSGGVGAELFHKIVASAGLDAGVDGHLIARLEAAPDHPTTIAFPEGEYLKGLAILKKEGPDAGPV